MASSDLRFNRNEQRLTEVELQKALGSTWLNLSLKSNEQCLVEAKTNHRQLNLRLFTADSDMQDNCYHAVQRLYFMQVTRVYLKYDYRRRQDKKGRQLPTQFNACTSMQVTRVVCIKYDYRRRQHKKGRQLLTCSSTPLHHTRVHFKLYIMGCLSSPTSIAHYQRSRGSNI